MLGHRIASLLCFNWADVRRLWSFQDLVTSCVLNPWRSDPRFSPAWLRCCNFACFGRFVFSFFVMIWTWSSCGWYKNSVPFHFILLGGKAHLVSWAKQMTLTLCWLTMMQILILGLTQNTKPQCLQASAFRQTTLILLSNDNSEKQGFPEMPG